MNRAEALSELSPAAQFAAKEALAGGLGTESLGGGGLGVGFDPAGCETAAVATFAPMHYEAGYAYPMIVWLHDAGQSEADLPRIMAHVSTRNHVAVAPAWERHGEPWGQDSEGIVATEQAVFDAIETAGDQFNVHPDRVFLAGAGRGGTAALRVALAHPESFAGVVSFDGPLPTGHAPLRSLNRLRGLPLMLGASDASKRYPQSHVCSDLRLLHSAGCTLHLRHEPGDGDLTSTMLAELDRWAMAIVCAADGAKV